MTQTVIIFFVLLLLVSLLGGWALMLTVALLGGSVSFGHSVLAFLLLRTLVLGTPFRKESD